MTIAMAIYTLAGIGLSTLCWLLSKAMLKAHSWLCSRPRPFTLRKRNAMLAEIEATFAQAWEASER